MEWSPVQFRDQALRAGRELPSEDLELAVGKYVSAGRFRRSDLAACIETAASLGRLRAPEAVAVSHRDRLQESLPDTLLPRRYGKRLAKLRRELFGRSEVPFKTYTDAAAWIKSHTGAARPLGTEEAQQIVQRLQELSGDLTERFEKPVAISLSEPALAYLSPDGESTMHVKVPTTGPLQDLKAFTEDVTSQTDLAESTVVAWVLQGQRPASATVEVSFKPSAAWPRILILVRAEELTEDHWRSARRMAKKMLHPRGLGPRAGRDRALLDVLKALGGIPRKGKMHFYRRVHSSLPEKHRPPSVDGTRMWISRLKKRASAAFSALPSS